MKYCLTTAFLFLTFFPAWGCAPTEPEPQETALVISPETTLITWPLTADGKRVDYLKAYENQAYPVGWNTDRNGYRLLAEKLGVEGNLFRFHYGTSGQQKQTLAKRIYEKLGIKSEPKLAEPVLDAWSYLSMLAKKENRDNNIPYDVLNHPWTFETYPELKPWLEEVTPKLEIAKEAFDKPIFCVPAVSVYGGDHPSFSQCEFDGFALQYRYYGKALWSRAYYRLGKGDMDGAIDDIITVHKIGYHLGCQKSILTMMIGVAVSGMADGFAFNANWPIPANREQLKRLLDASRQWRQECDFKMAISIDRYLALDLLQRIATEKDIRPIIDPLCFYWGADQKEWEKVRDERFGPLYSMAEHIKDWNQVIKRFNEMYDNARLMDWTRVDGYFDELEKYADSLVTKDGKFDDSHMSDAERVDCFTKIFMLRLHLPHNQILPLEALYRSHCINNLRQIGLAMLLYHEDHGTLPPAFTVDQKGKPLHSWRVLLLPYLGEESLYEKIRLDEPWDSEHNRQFHDTLVEVYRCPGTNVKLRGYLKPGTTTYSVVLGKTTPFNDSGKGRKLDEFGETSRDMVLAIETKRPICWMDPTREITLAQVETSLKEESNDNNRKWLNENIFSAHLGGFHAVIRSGSATFFSDTTDAERFLGMLQGTMLED